MGRGRNRSSRVRRSCSIGVCRWRYSGMPDERSSCQAGIHSHSSWFGGESCIHSPAGFTASSDGEEGMGNRAGAEYRVCCLHSCYQGTGVRRWRGVIMVDKFSDSDDKLCSEVYDDLVKFVKWLASSNHDDSNIMMDYDEIVGELMLELVKGVAHYKHLERKKLLAVIKRMMDNRISELRYKYYL